MRFLAYAGISILTVEWLRERGHDALHLREQGLQRLPDTEVLQKARSENRILITLDLDFGFLMASSHASWPSVITVRLHNQAVEIAKPRLAKVIENHREALETGALISVDEGGIRVRSLPV